MPDAGSFYLDRGLLESEQRWNEAKEGPVPGTGGRPGAGEAVRALAERWPLGLASSANREVIDLVLSLAGFADAFRVTVSSEEVERGKPAPDVYLKAARELRAAPARCVAVEDSSSGLRAAAAAGMTVIAVPNPHYPPDDGALALAAATVGVVGEVTPQL